MKGKSVIVYYSWLGNTQAVAKEIQNQTGFTVHKIEEKKGRRPGNIMGAAMGAFFGFKSSLKPMDFSLKEYDNIFLGAQIWAGRTTPAVNKYLAEACFKDKKVWLFITKADEKVPQKVIDSITRRIEKKGGKVIDSISITTKWDPKTNISAVPQDLKDVINEWLNKTGNK